MLSFNDDGLDDFKRGPQHSTPIKVDNCQKQEYLWDSTTYMDAGRFTNLEDFPFKVNNSVTEMKNTWPMSAEQMAVNFPHFMAASLNMCNHRSNVSSADEADTFSMSNNKKGQSTAAHIEQDVINKQRREIHLLMEELGTRDRELNDLVRSHQSQVQAWEKDRDRLSELQQRLHQYQDELERNDQQLKETVAEMTRVCEQKENDNEDLRQTKEEMELLADKINENSRYIQGMEVENKSLTQSVKELIRLRHEMEERDKDREVLIKDKDKQISNLEKNIEELTEELKILQSNSDEANEKICNANSESDSWKKKYYQAHEEAKRLQGDCTSKEETITRMTQQLHESLQQAIALQKALFTSCEREKCKEEVVYSMRKQQKRTMEELTSLRHLYDRQNRDLTVYHLSVREQERAQEQTRQQKRSRERCKSLEKIPVDEKVKEKRFRSKSELKYLPSDTSFLVKEQKTKSSSIHLCKDDKDKEENSKSMSHIAKNNSPITEEQCTEKTRRHSRYTLKSSNTNSEISSHKTESDMPQNNETESKQALVNCSRQECDHPIKSSQNESSSSHSDCVSSRNKRQSEISSTKADQWKKLSDNSIKRNSLHKEAGEYSDVSTLSSPERQTILDEEILSADSEGMCPELKRDACQMGNYSNFRQLPPKDRKNSILSDMPSSLEPSIHLSSSFLKKEKKVIHGSSADGKDTTSFQTSKSKCENNGRKQLRRENISRYSRKDGYGDRKCQEQVDSFDGTEVCAVARPQYSIIEKQGVKHNTNHFQAGDYHCQQSKTDCSEPKSNSRVQFSLTSANDSMAAAVLDVKRVSQNISKISNCKTDDFYESDDALEEISQSKPKIRFKNDSVKVISSSPDLVKNQMSNFIEREESDCVNVCNTPQSQNVNSSITDEVRGERRISIENSDGYLHKRTSIQQNKSRPGCQHSHYRNDNASNKMQTQKDCHKQFLNKKDKSVDFKDDKRSTKCLRFVENSCKDETNDDNSEISTESSGFIEPLKNDDSLRNSSHNTLQGMKSQHQSHLYGYKKSEKIHNRPTNSENIHNRPTISENIHNRPTISEEDSDSEIINQDKEHWYDTGISSASGRLSTARVYYYEEEKSECGSNHSQSCVNTSSNHVVNTSNHAVNTSNHVVNTSNHQNVQSFPSDKVSLSTVRVRPFCSTSQSQFYEKRQTKDNHKEIRSTTKQDHNYNNSNADFDISNCSLNKSEAPFTDKFEVVDSGSQITNEVDNLNSEKHPNSNRQLEAVHKGSLTYGATTVSTKETQPKPFCSTRAPSLYKQLSKIHFCEKTRRYEWTSYTKPQYEEESDTKMSDSHNEVSCSGDCSSSLQVSHIPQPTPPDPKHTGETPQSRPLEVNVNNKPCLDMHSDNEELLIRQLSQADSENSHDQHNESELFEKPSFLSPQNKPRNSKTNIPESKQFQKIVKKLNFSQTLDEDDFLNESDKNPAELKNIVPSQNDFDLSNEVNDVQNSYLNFDIESSNNPKQLNLKTFDDINMSVTKEAFESVSGDTQASKKGNPTENNFKLNKPTTETKLTSLPEYFKDISLITPTEDQDETGFQEDYGSVKDKALYVLEKSDIVQTQTLKILQLTSSGYMSFDLKEDLDLSNSNNFKLQSYRNSSHHDHQSHQSSGVPDGGSHEASNPCGNCSATETQSNKSLEKIPHRAFNSSIHKIIPMSPATKLHKLLLESQAMISSLENSSNCSQLLKTKNSLPSNC